MSKDLLDFQLPQERNSIIKVLGVGGGGSNAVNYMYKQGIRDVNFAIVNTDSQALNASEVPIKIRIGESLTEGRGAGNKPAIGKNAAQENMEDIVRAISDNTKMVFVTAGMGGGTGTGAAPEIARAAKERGLLTIGIVTLPFRFEGGKRLSQAVEGITEMSKHVDSLIVIDNEKLRDIYGDSTQREAFAKADNILAVAAKGIAEIITVPGHLNVDFADVKTVMDESGVALMGSAEAEGEDRAITAIQSALSSPLLNNNDIAGAKDVLLNITSGNKEVTMDEISAINEYVQEAAGYTADLIWGSTINEELGNKVAVTVVATGFETDIIPQLSVKKEKEVVKLVDPEGEKQKEAHAPAEEANTPPPPKPAPRPKPKKREEPDNPAGFEANGEDGDAFKNAAPLSPQSPSQGSGVPFKANKYSDNMEAIEEVPAYIRKGIKLPDHKHSDEREVSRFSLKDGEGNSPQIRDDNSYLHDNVD